MVLGNTQWILVPCEVDIESFDAGEVLEDIASDSAPRELLAFIPLMKRDSEDVIITSWLDVAGRDPDAGRWGDYSLALVFSEAVRCREKWQTALKGFTMIESPLVREWKAAAKIEGIIENKINWLVRVVLGKYKSGVDEVNEGIRRCQDQEKLDRWLDVALAAETLDEFRRQTGL